VGDTNDLQWIASALGAEAWDLCKQLQSVPRADSLRPVLSPDQLHFLQCQTEFALGPAKSKVAEPWNWFWTKILLEQASDEWTAQETAKDFPVSASVVDGCCGAGVDAIAIARHLAQHQAIDQRFWAIDSNPVACQLTQFNAKRNGIALSPMESRFEDVSLSRSTWLHLDPDRRVSGRRVNIHATEPNWDIISQRISQAPGASIKVAPGFQPERDFRWGECGPPQVRRWISKDASVRQQRLYWRIPRWHNATRVVSAFRNDIGWHHEIFEEYLDRTELFLANYGYNPIEHDASQLDDYDFVADQDPALRAANCVVSLSNRLGIKVIGNEFGYNAANRIIPHPMLRWFRVLDVLALDRKRIRAMSRSFKVGRWELKSRNVDVDLVQWRKELIIDTDSQRMGWLLITKVGKRHVCIVGEAV